MNPDLKAFLDKYVAAHPDATDDELRRAGQFFIQQQGSAAQPAAPAPTKPISMSDLANSAFEGLTMNWGDEGLGALTSLLGGNGDAVRDQIRAQDAQFHRDHPAADITTKLVAGAVPFLLGGGEAKAAGVAANALRGAGIGAGLGVVSGAGEGTDLKSREQGGIIGGVGGGLFGAAIPAGAALLHQVAPSSVALRELATAVAKSGGVQKLRQALADITGAGRGDEAMLADLSPQLATKLDFAANNSEDTFNAATQKLAARQKGASDRLQSDMTDLLSTTPDAEATMKTMQSARRNWANGPQGYGGLGLDQPADPIVLHDALKNALNTPDVARALRQARLAGDLDPNSPVAQIVRQFTPPPGMTLQQAVAQGLLQPGGVGGVQLPGVEPRALTWADLHELQQVFDDRATSAFNGGRGNLGKAYGTLRDAVQQALDDNVTGYAKVTAQYHGLMNLERAITAGGKMWEKVNTRGLQDEIAKLSPSELAAYRTGLASRMLDKLQSVATNRNEAGAYENASTNLHAKLKVVFGDDATAQEFLQRAKIEANFAKLRNVVGNSATYRRAAQAGHDPLEIGLDVTRAAMRGGHVYGAVSGLRRAAYGWNTRRIADALGPMLLSEGSGNSIADLLHAIENYNPTLGKLTGTVAPSVIGRVPSLFGLGQPPQQP